MLDRLVAALREAPAVPRVADARAVDELYRARRAHVLYGSMVAYGLFYFCRKNFSVAMPLMATDLHVTNEELGDLGSILYITYGSAKLASGLVADRASPRAFLFLGLAISAVVNVVFGLSSSLGVLAVLWGLNGVVQALGAPASAKLMAVWFSVSERGTRTGIWNISHQAGGGIVLVLAGVFAKHFGWRGCMIGPALIALAGAIAVASFIHDRPEASGLPPIEEHRDDPSATEDDTADVPFVRLLFSRVLLNPRVWLVALASGCLYVVRYGALDWSPKYLFESGQAPIASTAMLASLLEFAGIPGALLCGWLSDRVFGARRAPVAAISLLLLAASAWGLFRVPRDDPKLVAAMLALTGFFTYGPQLLLGGVSPVDLSSKRVAAAAVGFTGFVSYFAASVQSRITGRLIDAIGYGAAFDFFAIAALVGALLCVPMFRSTPKRVRKIA